jgi:hypothetical protein
MSILYSLLVFHALTAGGSAPAHAQTTDQHPIELREVLADVPGAAPPKLILPFEGADLPLSEPPLLTEGDVQTVTVAPGPAAGSAQVMATLSDAGMRRLKRASARLVGHRLATLIDGQITGTFLAPAGIETHPLPLTVPLPRARAEKIAGGLLSRLSSHPQKAKP